MFNLDGQITGSSIGILMKTCNTKTNNTSGVRRIMHDRILEKSINLFPPNDADVSHKIFIDKHSFQALWIFIFYFYLCVHCDCNN